MSSLPAGSQIVQIIGPQVPVLGMVPAKERALMVPGEFALLRDVRCDTGFPQVRRGVTSVLDKPSWAVGLPLGGTSVLMNGTRYVVAVYSDGTRGRVVVSPSGQTRWIEITSAQSWTGPSGDNRLTNVSSRVSFTVIPTLRAPGSVFKTSKDALLIQNGEDYPRIWDPSTEVETNANISSISGTGSGPVTVTLATPLTQLASGDHVWISDCGLSGANGIWEVTRTSDTVFQLVGSNSISGSASSGKLSDKADFLVHKPITSHGTTGKSFATLPFNWRVVGTTGKTYTNSGSHFTLANSNTAPYNNENTTIVWTFDSSAMNGDAASVKFGTGMYIDRQLVMLLEGDSVSAMVEHVKIEVNPDNVPYASITSPWQTIYDPEGSDSTKKQAFTISENDTNHRQWYVFNTTSITSQNYYHLRITRQTNIAGASGNAYLLFAGSANSDLASTSNFGFSYEDALNCAEGPIVLLPTYADPISLLGGVKLVKDGSSTTSSPMLPLDDRLITSFRFNLNNGLLNSYIPGGLNGEPDSCNIYISQPGSDRFYFLARHELYSPLISGGLRQWKKPSSPYDQVILNISTANGSLRNFIQYNREAPSEFQIPIPVAQTCLYTNGRLFCGNTKTLPKDYARGDVYFSWTRFPFRFQQVQEDELRGGYIQVAGEAVQAFVASASASLGSGRVYLFTDQNLYSLGDAGPFSSAGFQATDLSRPVKIGPHGTLSPLSIAQGYNAMYWIDKDVQMMRLSQGGLQNIGKYRIHNRLEQSPPARKNRMAGVFMNDRYYLAYTPAVETDNNRVLVWNERMQAIESEDYPAYKFEIPFIHTSTSGSLSTSRIYFFDIGGDMKSHEQRSDSDDGQAIKARIETKAILQSQWSGFYIDECLATVTTLELSTMSISRIPRKWGPDDSWTNTISIGDTGTDYSTYRDRFIRGKSGTQSTLESDSEWHLDLSAYLPPGTKFLRFECTTCSAGVSAGRR